MMSARSATNTTIVTILSGWLLLVGYSVAISFLIPSAPWWGMVGYYAFGMATIYHVHSVAHIQFLQGGVFGSHRAHHTRAFFHGPSPCFVWPAESVFLAAAGACVLVGSSLVVGMDGAFVGAGAVLYGVMGVGGSFVHNAFHTRDHYLSCYAAFRVLRAAHYVHHVGLDEPCVVTQSRLGPIAGSAVAFETRFPEHMRPLVPAHPGAMDEGKEEAETEYGVITKEELEAAVGLGPLVAHSVGLELPVPVPAADASFPHVQQEMESASSRGVGPVCVRIAVIIALALTWILSHHVIRSITEPMVEPKAADSFAIGDALHEVTYLWHHYVASHPHVGSVSIMVLDSLIDMMVVVIILVAALGPTIRPAFSGYAAVVLRQVAQSLCELPAPSASLWDPSASTSILFQAYPVDPGSRPDYFFSMYMAISVVACIELLRLLSHASHGRVGFASFVCVVLVVLMAVMIAVLRMDWTLSLFTGILAGSFASLIGARVAPYVDVLLP